MNFDHHQTTARRRQKAGTSLMYFTVFLLFVSATLKVAHVTPIVTRFAELGFAGPKLVLVAVLELSCTLLFLIPATRSGGLLLLSSYMGGAISVHVAHGELPIPSALVLTLIWLAAWLRHPEVLWSLDRRAEETSERLSHPRGAAAFRPGDAL